MAEDILSSGSPSPPNRGLLLHRVVHVLRPREPGLETLVVGGAESTWANASSSSGNVIDFATEPGWIVPIQIDPDVNLIQQVRDRGERVPVLVPIAGARVFH